MKKVSMLLALAMILFIAACGSRDADVEKITALEKELFSSSNSFDEKKANELLGLYESFADKHSKDSLAPIYLFKAAGVAKSLKKGEDAVRLYDRIINDYPETKNMAMVYFMKAFVYDDELKNITKAREAYTEFLKKYPDHEFADDAQINMNNLGKTDEQIIKEFEAKNQHLLDSLAEAQK